MPIRFRCRHCNQLMGIARRKAGMMVHCPTCHGQIVVPQPDGDGPNAPPVSAPPPPPPVFERSDFEAFLQEPAREEPPAPAANPFPPPPPSPSPYEAERFNPSSLSLTPGASTVSRRPVGLVLSPTQATWLTVVGILLLALAFGAGLLIGHYWMG